MGYYIDLKKFSLDEFKEILKSTELIPSWKILEEDIDDNFKTLKELGINNLEKLLRAFKNKEDIIAFSKISKLSEKYLQVLNRVAKGYIQKPNKFSDFVNISKETATILEEHGFINTLKIYQYILTKQDREKLTSHEYNGSIIPLHMYFMKLDLILQRKSQKQIRKTYTK